MTTLEREIYKLGFQISPVILTGGIAALIPGGMLPIVALTEAASFATGLLTGSTDISTDNFNAHWRPMPGGTLIENQAGEYPYANIATAANAIIRQPNRISMLMDYSPRKAGAMLNRLSSITALQNILASHSNLGGTYVVATPSFIYTDCLLMRLSDATNSGGSAVQTAWQFDFYQPLITLSDAKAAYNSLMGKLSSGAVVSSNPTWSGLASTVGSTVSSAASSIVSTASNLIGSL